jgi:hypothetical protein
MLAMQKKLKFNSSDSDSEAEGGEDFSKLN